MTTLSNVWVNGDGLAVKFGKEEGTVGKIGDHADTWGPLNVSEVHFDYTDIPSLANILVAPQGILDYTTVIPAGSRIQEVRIWAETAATSGGSATLDVGLIQMDFATELDYNGLIAALALTAVDTAGEQTVLNKGSTSAGALIGTTTSVDGFLTVNYNTASFTAGKFIVQVMYYKPIST